MAVNAKREQIAFFEIKWGKLSYREAEKLLHALSDKAKLVEWHVKGGDKREYYGLIAQSIEGKEEFRKQGFKVYDLEELKAFPINWKGPTPLAQ